VLHPSVLPTDADRARRMVRAITQPLPGCEALDDDLLEDIAAGLARSVTPQLLPPREERRWSRLLVTYSYDAWLIGWPPGTGLDLHDHGGSQGALCVVRGTLDESRLVRGSGGGVAARRLTAGTASSFGPHHVHAIHNTSPDIEALSVHVYSPPLSTMNFVDDRLARAVS
jgi:hypothetical protein